MASVALGISLRLFPWAVGAFRSRVVSLGGTQHGKRDFKSVFPVVTPGPVGSDGFL